MNPFTLNGRKAGGGIGTISAKPITTGGIASTTKGAGVTALGGTATSGAGLLTVPNGKESTLSSINGDKTP
jgi:hypothetical protein